MRTTLDTFENVSKYNSCEADVTGNGSRSEGAGCGQGWGGSSGLPQHGGQRAEAWCACQLLLRLRQLPANPTSYDKQRLVQRRRPPPPPNSLTPDIYHNHR